MTPAPAPALRSRLIERSGVRVGVLTFARSERKNALTPGMLADAREALAAQVSGGAGCIVLEGEGAAFCAGFDLELCAATPEALRELLVGLAALLRAMRSCPCPVVVGAHGAAIAGGCAMLCAADVVVTHNDCKLGYPVVRLGISPAVSAPMLASATGHGPARERLLSAQLISGWDALQIGLVHECIDDAGKVRDRALSIALALAGKPAQAMHATKAWLNELDPSARDGVLDQALAASLALVGSPEQRSRLGELWKAG